MSANIVGSIRLAEMISNFWNNRAKKQLNEVIAEAEQILESDHYFGYLVKNDKIGYLRALSKAKSTFRGLNRDDVTEGMIDGEGVNPLFVEMVEDFYYSEIRKEARIYDLKLARYNALRDELIERFEGDERVESIAQEDYNISKQEYFNRIKKDELVYTFSKLKNAWVAVPYGRYVVGVKKGLATENYPIAS